MIGFEALPGEGSESAGFGLARYPATIEVCDRRQGGTRRMATKLGGWCWSGFCKTEYASKPERGGVANFRDGGLSFNEQDLNMPDLKDGEFIEIQGSARSPYILKNVGGVYSCTCPAWRNQSLAIERRTCKHLRAYRGEDAEKARIGGVLPAATQPTSSDAGTTAPGLLLAHTWENDVDLTEWWMSEKLDGVRASGHRNPGCAPNPAFVVRVASTSTRIRKIARAAVPAKSRTTPAMFGLRSTTSMRASLPPPAITAACWIELTSPR